MSTENADQFQIEMIEGVCVVVPAPRVESLEWERVEPLADQVVEAALETDAPKVLFDLTDVDYFGSVFLSLMLRCWKQIEKQSGVFAVCGADNHSREVLTVAHLDDLWSVYKDRAAALTALQGG